MGAVQPQRIDGRGKVGLAGNFEAAVPGGLRFENVGDFFQLAFGYLG